MPKKPTKPHRKGPKEKDTQSYHMTNEDHDFVNLLRLVLMAGDEKNQNVSRGEAVSFMIAHLKDTSPDIMKRIELLKDMREIDDDPNEENK